MSYEVYVGNYPTEFTRNDVSNLFKEFPGAIVSKFFKKDIKSYAFLQINDIETTVSVVKRMNNAVVSGRKLKVRASNEDLQEYITLLINSECEDTAVSLNTKTSAVREENKCSVKYSKHFTGDNSTSPSLIGRKVEPTKSCSALKEDKSNIVSNENKCSKMGYRDNSIDRTPFVPNQVLRSSTARQIECGRTLPKKPETNSNYPDSETASIGSNLSSTLLLNDTQVMQKKINQAESCATFKENNSSAVYKENKFSKRCTEEILQDNCADSTPFVPYQVLRSNTASRLERERTVHKELETNSYWSSTVENHFDKYCNSDYPDSETASFRSNSSNPILLDDEEFAECVWLSVTNFPIGTKTKSIYKLFDEFQPLKVLMICNYPRPDLMLTEAYVCFLNRDIADDVILNFDNTMFRGRLLLVNDIEDLTVMSELMSDFHL